MQSASRSVIFQPEPYCPSIYFYLTCSTIQDLCDQQVIPEANEIHRWMFGLSSKNGRHKLRWVLVPSE